MIRIQTSIFFMLIFALVSCAEEDGYDLASIEYRCPDGGTIDLFCPRDKVPGVYRQKRSYPSCTYWVPCTRATYAPDVELCRRVGAGRRLAAYWKSKS